MQVDRPSQTRLIKYQMTTPIAITIISLLILFTPGYLLIMGIGKPDSTNISVTGQAKPVSVLIDDNFSPTAADTHNRLRQASNDYDSRLDFAVAGTGSPQGQAFANRYHLADGSPLPVTIISAVLRNNLKPKLAANDGQAGLQWRQVYSPQGQI